MDNLAADTRPVEASSVVNRADNLADTALHRKEASHLPAGNPVVNPVVASTEASREGSVLPHKVDTARRHNRITRHRVTRATLMDGSSHLRPERTDKISAHKYALTKKTPEHTHVPRGFSCQHNR